MMNHTQLDLMITGAAVKNYTDAANILSAIGADIDELIASDDNQPHIEAASKIYLHLNSMKTAVEAFIEDINGYLDAATNTEKAEDIDAGENAENVQPTQSDSSEVENE